MGDLGSLIDSILPFGLLTESLFMT